MNRLRRKGFVLAMVVATLASAGGTALVTALFAPQPKVKHVLIKPPERVRSLLLPRTK